MPSPTLTVAILAGGAASRLDGRDKGLETVDGTPLIARARAYCERVIARDMDFLIIANRHLDEYARYGRVRTDATTGFQGPLAGVASALEGAAAARVLTLPVDCPSPPDDLAARLIGAFGDHDVVVAHDGERRQPLFALYRRELAASAAEAAASGQGVWEWQDSIGAVEVDFADRRQQFHNLNTPEEFAAYNDAVRQRD
ncbi:MAG TPA: NTP transferase domain-containing protein [Rhodanobacteraceae bacterium]|nr:NTP transferase domain-containing protein [Rhodanobacteraceae bacterium]